MIIKIIVQTYLIIHCIRDKYVVNNYNFGFFGVLYLPNTLRAVLLSPSSPNLSLGIDNMDDTRRTFLQWKLDLKNKINITLFNVTLCISCPNYLNWDKTICSHNVAPSASIQCPPLSMSNIIISTIMCDFVVRV